MDSDRKLVFSKVCAEIADMLQEFYGQTEMKVAMKLDEAKQLLLQGRTHETITACQQILQLEPGNFDAVLVLGKAANQLGKYDLAEGFFRAAVTLQPESVDAIKELGAVLLMLKQPESALECYRQALRLRPGSAQTNLDICTVLFDLGQLEEAGRYCQAALSLQPGFMAALVRMAVIHNRRDDPHNSLEMLYRAQQLAPDDLNVTALIANEKLTLGLPDEAMPYLEQVLARLPGNAFAKARIQEAQNALREPSAPREVLYNAGMLAEAEELARQDLARDDSVENHNFLLKCYLASDRHSARDYYNESRAWAQGHEHEDALPAPAEFRNKRDPNRRLRIGIVGDYFVGVIGSYTLYPLFKSYDRSRIELFCYNFGPGGESIRPMVDCYRDISQMSGDAFFKLIRDDVIDIMLDINGRIRTPNHFETLLRQPAPIQVNWYNLPCTVGVKAFNYAIADEYCVRDGDETVFVEKVFKMPTGTIVAWDMGVPPEVPPPPCVQNGYITFGCFADFFKVGYGVLEAWATLLKRVPGSRLYLKSNNLRLRAERERVTAFFSKRDIAPERLIMEGLSSFRRMKKCYEWVDIAIDTFPYSSGSTTINALWQGVPLVAINGDDWRGRTAAAVLAGAQLDGFIARDVGDYIDKAWALAADPAQLVELRATLGKRMAASPQWDVKSFACNFESRLRMIWQDWLKQTATGSDGAASARLNG